MQGDSGRGSPANWSFDVGFRTDVGLHRERNEDAYHVFVPYPGESSADGADAVFAVADGMGGHEGGDIAGRFVAEAVGSEFATSDSPASNDPSASEDLATRFAAFVTDVDQDLRGIAKELGAGQAVGSTLTMAIVRGEEIHVAHVGDSRCYRFAAGRLEQLTPDHSWVAEQTRAGLMTPDEAAVHSDRNMLTQCLGVGGRVVPFVASEPLTASTRYLISSDGLHGMVTDHLIERVLAIEPNPQDAADHLVRLALKAGGHDNVTVVVIDVRAADPLVVTLPGGVPVETRMKSRRGHAAIGLGGLVVLLTLGAAAWLAWRGDRPEAAGLDVPPQPPVADSLATLLGDPSPTRQRAIAEIDSVWSIGEPAPDPIRPD